MVMGVVILLQAVVRKKRTRENKNMRKVVLTIVFCVAVFCQLPVIGAAADGEWGRLIYQKDSLYHRILVYKRGSVVTLRFGKQPAVQVQSQVDLNNLRAAYAELHKTCLLRAVV